MTRLRRILGPIAAAWLACQAAGFTTAPIVWWITAPADVVECTCTHGDHAICPMHHRPASDARCAIQAAQQSDTMALSTLLSGVGISASVSVGIAPAPITNAWRFDLAPASFRPARPDPPPPRA